MIPDPTACCASPGREWDPEEASIVSQHVGPEQPHARSRLQHCSFELVVEKWIELHAGTPRPSLVVPSLPEALPQCRSS